MFNRNAKYFHKTILIGVSFTIKGVVVTVKTSIINHHLTELTVF